MADKKKETEKKELEKKDLPKDDKTKNNKNKDSQDNQFNLQDTETHFKNSKEFAEGYYSKEKLAEMDKIASYFKKKGYFDSGSSNKESKSDGEEGDGGDGDLGSPEDYGKNLISENFGINMETLYKSYVKIDRVQAWGIADQKSFDKINKELTANGVSPAFFWSYETGEGYNSGNSFLNHFEGYSSDPVKEAKRTAQWAKEVSNQEGGLAWYDAGNPYYTTAESKQDKGKKYLKDSSKGCIARVMLQGTAAATWAMFDPPALKSGVNGVRDYGDPFSHQISMIKSWGGGKKKKGKKEKGKGGQKDSGKFISPIDNPVITSNYGGRSGEFHLGIDIGNPAGTEIKASRSGTVMSADVIQSGMDSYGKYVTIEHDGPYLTLYAHQSKIVCSNGDKVKQGQVIGYVGSTGNSTGPHCHFEIYESKQYGENRVDPRSHVTFPAPIW